jgi:hypothetical protein
MRRSEADWRARSLTSTGAAPFTPRPTQPLHFRTAGRRAQVVTTLEWHSRGTNRPHPTAEPRSGPQSQAGLPPLKVLVPRNVCPPVPATSRRVRPAPRRNRFAPGSGGYGWADVPWDEGPAKAPGTTLLSHIPGLVVGPQSHDGLWQLRPGGDPHASTLLYQQETSAPDSLQYENSPAASMYTVTRATP